MCLTVLAVQPNKDTSRALEAETREKILKMSDDAIYERRNASIEQERGVKENEYNCGSNSVLVCKAGLPSRTYKMTLIFTKYL